MIADTDTNVSAEPSPSSSVMTSRLDGPTDSQIIRLGQEAWNRVHSDLNWEDWIAIGRAHVIGRTEAMREAYVNEPAGHQYKEAFSAWLERFGFASLDKGDRSRLFEVMDHLPQIETWRARLTTTERLRLNHPSTVLRKWRKAAQVPKQDAKLSPMCKVKAALAETIEENHRLKQEIDRGGGDLWTATDRADDIAAIMVTKLTRNKAEQVARAILRRLKETAEAAP
jgi:hypothetical protein